jgi:hypothetical protein
MWCIGTLTADFIAQMERILFLYGQEANPICPLVCVDEKSYQMLGDVLQPIEMKPGQDKRQSDKYSRHGVVQIFVAFLPLWGLRFVWICPKRRAWDFAGFIKALLEDFLPCFLPQAKSIRLVCDNLNTHNKGSFYKTFEAWEAFDLAQKIEFNYTPVNASWLNMAEMEIHALSTICLKRRMNDQKFVTTEVQQLVKERNDLRIKVNWQFDCIKARETFNKAYSKLNS